MQASKLTKMILDGNLDISFSSREERGRSWKSSKQETLADSTIEAEYIAATKEAVWIRK